MPRSRSIFMIALMAHTTVLDSRSIGDVDISTSLPSARPNPPPVSVTVSPVLMPNSNDVDVFTPLPARSARCADGNGTFSGLFFSDDDVDIAAELVQFSSGLFQTYFMRVA